MACAHQVRKLIELANPMSLRELLVVRKDAVAKRWLGKTLATYHRDTAAFFAKGKNQFANPVGTTLDQGIHALLDAMLDEAHSPEQLCAALEPMIKIRSVQEFTAAKAVAFVFSLKSSVREELGEALADPSLGAELADFDTQVDQLALFAFDVYTKSRDRFHEVRINDVKRRVSGLMRRMGIGLDDLDALDPKSGSGGDAGS